MSARKKRLSKCMESDSNIPQSFTDFRCPICLEILVEPVQMPCKHELCMQCFQMHVYKTSLTCPMCRLRISTWARIHAKNKTLVNMERWKLIQELFPDRVRSRLEDIEYEEEEKIEPVRIIAESGELRKEYEEQLRQYEAERLAATELDLSYVNKLREMEREEQEKQLQLDMKQAKELQMEEMRQLGVTLKSPSMHQQEIFDMFRPKSPMKLRSSSVSVSTPVNYSQTRRRRSSMKEKTSRTSIKSPSNACRKISLTQQSESSTIRSPILNSFFQKSPPTSRKSVEQNSQFNLDFELSYQMQAKNNGIKCPSVSPCKKNAGKYSSTTMTSSTAMTSKVNDRNPVETSCTQNQSTSSIKTSNQTDGSAQAFTRNSLKSTSQKTEISVNSKSKVKPAQTYTIQKFLKTGLKSKLDSRGKDEKLKNPFRDMKNELVNKSTNSIQQNGVRQKKQKQCFILIEDENSPVF